MKVRRARPWHLGLTVEYEGEYVRSLDPLHHFRGHAWIHFNCCNVFRLFEYFDCEVAGTGADFQDFVCRFEIGLDRASTMTMIQRRSEHFTKGQTNRINYPGLCELCTSPGGYRWVHTVGMFVGF